MKLGELIREEVLGVAERINLSLGFIRLDCSEFEVHNLWTVVFETYLNPCTAVGMLETSILLQW